MLVQSGKPVGVMRTHEWAPRVLIANSNLVPDWANWPEFRRLEHLGLTMYGQMTAGSWIYIGTQGIVQGTYETFAAVAEKRFGGTLRGTLTVTGGCGGMGGAQPLAVTMNDGVVLVVDVDADAPRAPRARPLPRRVDRATSTTRSTRVLAAKRERRPLSVGLEGNCAYVLPELLRRGIEVDIVTDQTSAHDPLVVPAARRDARGVARLRGARPRGLHRARARESMATPRRGDGRLHGRRRRGLRLRQLDPRRGRARRLHARLGVPRLRARLHPAALLRGQGPVPLGRALGRPRRHRRDRQGRARALPRQRAAAPLDHAGAGQDRVPGPARAHLLARLRRARQGRRALQRDGRRRHAQGAHRHRPRPPRLRQRRIARTARPRRCSTAPTRSPTGRCSTRS